MGFGGYVAGLQSTLNERGYEMNNEEFALALVKMTVASDVGWKSSEPFERTKEIRGLYEDVLKRLNAESSSRASKSMDEITRLQGL
jgi:hypothetical protein